MEKIDLKNLRKARGWTQTDLAHALGVHLATIWRWEKDGIPQRGAARAAIDKLAGESPPVAAE